MMSAKTSFSVIAFLCLATSTWAVQSNAYTPKRGSKERITILNALRKPVEKDLGKKTIFKVEHFKVKDDWAYIRAVPLMPGEKTMDYKGTSYYDIVKQGNFTDGISALLRKKKDKWESVLFVIGMPADFAKDWHKEYDAPPEIFPKPRND